VNFEVRSRSEKLKWEVEMRMIRSPLWKMIYCIPLVAKRLQPTAKSEVIENNEAL
jgi:hypothetical protein